jgi:hypothetical protein
MTPIHPASRLVGHRYFASIANIGDVSFHAGLNAALARLSARAKLFHTRRLIKIGG